MYGIGGRHRKGVTMKTPIDRPVHEGKYLSIVYSREDERFKFSFYQDYINKKEWGNFKKELEDIIKIEIK